MRSKYLTFNLEKQNNYKKIVAFFFLQKAILEAKSIEEVDRLKALLQAGQMPNSAEQKHHQNGHKSNVEGTENDHHAMET